MVAVTGFRPSAARGQLDFACIFGGLHDDLRKTIEHAARPGRGDGLTDHFHIHIRVEAATARLVEHAHGDDIVARMQSLFDIIGRLGRPVGGFADKLVVHKNPAMIVNAAETNLRRRVGEIGFGHVDMRAINGRLILT